MPLLVVTQQHGNEPASTEAVFIFLEALERNPRLRVRLLRGYDIVIVIRANPDGGEPSGNLNITVAPFTESKGFFRHNVDPAAGGGFLADSEPGFFGIVGRGYDMNRYHYVELDGPIRPVETQALVAAQLAFRPRVIFDMHGDVQKSACEVDRSSIVSGSVLGFLPSGSCKTRPDFVPSLASRRNETIVGSFFATDQAITTSDESARLVLTRPLTFVQTLLRKSISSIVFGLQPRINGTLARFSQLALGGASHEGALLGEAADKIGAIGAGWEVINFVSAFRAAAVSLKMINGTPVPDLSAEPYIPEPCFLPDNICLHELFLRTTLSLLAGKSFKDLSAIREFCDIPLASGLITSAPSSLGWGALSLESDVLVPLGRFPAAPATIISTCPNDLKDVA
ncbi:Zinc carboxypeptidase [Gracilaria domingensis]|nr:Zinc carboxypeptidase [Gracilaria domingensis]